MAKKWNEEKIKKYINSENYEVLYCKYDKNRSKWKLILICPNFHIIKIDFDKFQQGRRCKICKDFCHTEEFVYEYIKNNGEKLLSHFKNDNTPIDVICKYGHIYHPTFSNYYNKNTRCPICANNVKKEHEKFIEELKEINPYIKILSEYVNSHKKIKCECKIDGYQWETTPSHLISLKTGCPRCAIKNNSGENNYRWCHNKTQEEREDDRSYKEYHQWVKKVYERDNYICQCCGERGGKLNAHHKDGYNWCKERRLDVTNGVTLCENCHKTFHKIYGNGNNTEQQYIEWLQLK